jgi:uncharacterized protein YcgL (UPF0745 family)
MAKIHMNIEKVSNVGALGVKYNHNMRTNPNEDLSHIDSTKTYLNHDIVNVNNTYYRDLVMGRIEEVSVMCGHNIKKRKDAVIALSVYIAYTHGAEKTNGFTIEEWEQAVYHWLCNYFGKDNVVSAYVHLDESSPHIHAIVVPVTPDLRLCAKDFTGGRKKLSQIHRSLGETFGKPPFCMEMPKQNVKKASHTSVRAFYDEINQIDNYELPVKEQEEGLDAYLDRLLRYVKKKEYKNLAERKHLEEQISHLQADFRSLWINYRQAINLQQYLTRTLGNKEDVDRELLNLYQLEHYPREVLTKLTEKFDEKYDIDGNLINERIKTGDRNSSRKENTQ